MTLLAEAPPASAPAETAPWLPTRMSQPLSEDFPSHADWLIPLLELTWRLPSGDRLVLDDWQRWVIRHALEVYPDGHPRAGELRYRQVVISMGRQNGKSVLGAAFGLYGLVREAGALVIGIASSAEQARIIYVRLLAVIKGHPSLSKRFARLTDTRGIQSKDGGRYEIKASKSAAVQGLDLTVGLCDELHLLKIELWSDMVNGTRSRRNGLVAGITTAGDETSELLLSLYAAMEGTPSPRFGYFVWEAPEPRTPLLADGTTIDRAALAEYVVAANPAVACGRIDLETVLDDIQDQPEPDRVRYTLNRFVSSTNVFMTPTMWKTCAGDVGTATAPVFAVDRTPDWGYASIVAAWTVGDVVHTEVVASFVRPSTESLVAECVRLARFSPKAFVVDGYTLKGVGSELKRRGLRVQMASLGDVCSASSRFYARVVQRGLVHADDALMRRQIPKAARKNVGEAFRVTRTDSGAQIDTVIATLLACYFAETVTDVGMQLF